MIGQLAGAHSRRFDRRAAIVLALAAARSYWDEELIRRDVQRANVRYVRIRRGSHAADVITENGTHIVAFRGTDDVRDWLANLNIDRVDRCGGQVHQGFHKAEQSLAERVLEELPATDSRVWITGHSLGGALATLFAYRLQKSGRDVAGLYTFGAPRVGCRCFARQHNWLLNDRHFRVLNNSDAVPRVPLPFRFRHCGQQVLINRHAKLMVQPNVLYQWYDRLLGYRFDWVRDHLMGAYLSGLLNNRGTELEDEKFAEPAVAAGVHDRRVVDSADHRRLGA